MIKQKATKTSGGIFHFLQSLEGLNTEATREKFVINLQEYLQSHAHIILNIKKENL